MTKKLILTIIAILFVFALHSYERYVDFDLLKSYGPPRFVRNGVLFTLPGAKYTSVFLRTDLDSWRSDYYYKASIYGILYAFVPFEKGVKSFRYKLNINGYWTTDPNNKETAEDDVGHELSLVNIKESSGYFSEFPSVEKNKNILKKVVFRYYNPYASEVNLVLSADNWNEYSHPMTKMDNGWWEITKSYSSGKYFYYYFADGKKMIDIENDNKIYNLEKGQVNYFIIE